MTRHCPGHCEIYRFFLHRSRRRCSSSHCRLSLRVFHDLFVSSFCLCDETEHFALRRLYHSFMLFGGCPCSRSIAYRRSYCCVEQSETVFEQVVFRCQFLPVFVTSLDFGRFLLLECNQLALVSHAFTSCQDFNLKIVDLHFFFRFRAKAALVAENFRLSWVDLGTHLFSTFLEFVQHFLKLILGGCEQKHVVGEPQVCEAVVVVVAQVDSHSFLLLPALGDFFQ